MTAPLNIYGVGGFAREVAWLVDSCPSLGYAVNGFIDGMNNRMGSWPDPRPVLSLEDACKAHEHLSCALALGSPAAKREVDAILMAARMHTPTLVHEQCVISERNTLGDGCIVCAGSQLTVEIELGRHVHVNLNCTIGHDVVIGDYCTLSPGVHVSGAVHIDNDVFVGTGASIINGTSEEPLHIAPGCVIAAGACVTRSTEPYTLYAGVPAVAKKQLPIPAHAESVPVLVRAA